MAQYRTAGKFERRQWEHAFDAARFCYASDVAQEALTKLWLGGAPSVAAAASTPTEVVRLDYFMAYNMFAWVQGDRFTTSGGLATSLVDRVAAGVGARSINAAHAFTQAAPGAQVANTTNDSALGNKPSFVFTGAQYYASNISPASWLFSKDGTGLMIACAMVPTDISVSSVVCATSGVSGQNGLQAIIANPGNMVMGVANLTGVVTLTAASSLANGVAAKLVMTYREADAPKATLRSGAAFVSGPSTAVPDAAITSSMYIGGRSDVVALAKLRLADIAFAKLPTLFAPVLRYYFLRYGLV